MSRAILRAKWIAAADFSKGRTRPVSAVILHSTCGRKAGDIATLTEAGGPVVSVHFYVTRAGELFQFVDLADTAYHAGKVDKPEHGNSATVGIEQEHWDPDDDHPNGEDWPDAQLLVVAQLVAYLRQKYGSDIPALAHAAVAAPKGRKEDPADYPWAIFSKLVHEASATTWTLQRV